MASSSTSGGARSDTRLYVGNLHPSVDEYTLIQTFSKYGKISKLDYLFHKVGPLKGKPRGYAFLEYTTKGEAMQATVEAHDKTLRGRKLVVTQANHSQYPEGGTSGTGPHRRSQSDLSKPTTLSLIKNARRPEGTDAKIAAMEAKLSAMRDKRRAEQGSSEQPSALGSSSTLTPHPSLPIKPLPGASARTAVSHSSSKQSR